MAALLPHDRAGDPLVATALVVMIAVLYRVRFEIGTVTAGAEQLVLVPMLLLLPPAARAAARGVRLPARAGARLRQAGDPSRPLDACFTDATFALGPALVIGLLAPGEPRLEHIEIYALAFAAQVAVGLAVAVVVDRLLYGISTLEVVRQTLWVSRIDAVLTPHRLRHRDARRRGAAGAARDPSAGLAAPGVLARAPRALRGGASSWARPTAAP